VSNKTKISDISLQEKIFFTESGHPIMFSFSLEKQPHFKLN